MATIHNDRDIALQAMSPRIRIITNSFNKPYSVNMWTSRKPTAGEIIVKHEFPIPVAFPINAAESLFTCIVLPTDTAEFSIKRDGTEIGKATFYTSSNHTYNYYLSSRYLSSNYTGSNCAFFSGLTSVSNFAAAQNITIVAPTPADATLSGLALTLKGGR